MILDWEKYTATARQVVAEGCVLLKNNADTLPIKKGSKLAMFGRIQRHYYKSGTGSGGMVNVSKVVGILDALLESPEVQVDQDLLQVYDKWEEENPFDEGVGWANEPWSQKEMPLSEELVKETAARNDVALVIIGRTAGEDKDNVDKKGAYRLSDTESDMIKKVTAHFAKTIVVFNIGSIMDMSHPCLEKCQAILYGWQGGMVGGDGVADVLLGRVCPSGRMVDTVAERIEDYPSTAYFGDEVRNFYKEDIYVGYRYFETVAKDKVMYPFGFGLSYTEFEETAENLSQKDGHISLDVRVKNTGKMSGKQVMQVYVEAPQGALGKASRVLVAFGKTAELAPQEEESLHFDIAPYAYASYDDSGVTGEAYSYVLEAGEYGVYVGENVRDAECVGTFTLGQTKVVEQCSQNLAPTLVFDRMKPEESQMGDLTMAWEAVPTGREVEAAKRMAHLPKEIPYTGDQGHRLTDVESGKITMEQFVAQLSDEDLSCIIRGEGMGSPKVTPGTAAAYGGVSKRLQDFGIPCACCSDGPSGMRIDCGKKAFSLPNGTLMACTFNLSLIEELYTYLGKEMIRNQIDNILGPGMNIHRHPLNGRNFEYFSEDPYVTGKMAAAQVRGLKSQGVTGTLKHFAGNNQETKRTESDSVMSERALREIYLKGFEIVVKEGGADSVMTTYGPLNGVWTAGRYELNTSILRQEWGFDGIVMTDWWAKISRQGKPEEARGNDFATMAMAQNDLYMVCPEGDKNCTEDNTLEALAKEDLTRGELQRNAINICRQLMTLPTYRRSKGENVSVEVVNKPVDNDDFSVEDIVYYDVTSETVIPMDGVDTTKGANFVFAMSMEKQGIYEMEITFRSEREVMAQIPVTIFTQSVPVGVVTFNGTGGKWHSLTKRVCVATKYAVVRLYFAQSGVELLEMKLRLAEQVKDEGAPMDVEGDYDMAFR